MPVVQTNVVVTTNDSSAGRGYVDGIDSSTGDINRTVTLSVVEKPGYVFTQWEIERIPVQLSFVSYRSNIIGGSPDVVCNLLASSISTLYTFYEDAQGNWYYDAQGLQPALDGYYAMGRAQFLQVLNQKPVTVSSIFLQSCPTTSTKTPTGGTGGGDTGSTLPCSEEPPICARNQIATCVNGSWACLDQVVQA